MHSLASYKSWDDGSPPDQDEAILLSPPMTYDSPPLTFSSDLTPEISLADQATAAITLDEHCYATPETLFPRDSTSA